MNAPCTYTLPTINFVGGATQKLMFHTYYYQGKHPFDLSFCTAKFAIVSYNNKHTKPKVLKNMTIQNNTRPDEEPVPNILYVELEASDTVDLEGKYIYQITIQADSGDVEIPDQGIMYITNNIDRDSIR